MNFRIFHILIPVLLTVQTSYGQSGSFIAGVDHFQKTNQFFRYLLSDQSLGLKLGYAKSLSKEAWRVEATGFANYLDYNFDISPDRYFSGGTLFTGLGLTPWYCLNPDRKFRVSLGALFKGQCSFGQGNVFERSQTQAVDERIEKKFSASGFGIGFSPQLTIDYPVALGRVGLEAGWDSSDAGKGVNKLRSSYYKPINYHSSSFFLGLVFRINP